MAQYTYDGKYVPNFVTLTDEEEFGPNFKYISTKGPAGSSLKGFTSIYTKGIKGSPAGNPFSGWSVSGSKLD